MIAPLILYSPGSFLFFEQYSSSVVVPVIIPLGALLFNYYNTLPFHALPFLYAMYTRGSTETLIIIASASKLRYIPLAYLGNVIEPIGMFSDA